MALRGESGGNDEPGGIGSALDSVQLPSAGQAGEAQSQYPGLVYLGMTPGVQQSENRRRELISQGIPPARGNVGRVPRYVSGEEALQEYYNWAPRRREDFIAQAKVAGLIPSEGGEIEGARLWRTLVEEASYYNPYGTTERKRVSPWDILTSYVRQSGTSASGWRRDPSNPNFEVNMVTGERRYVGPRFTTQTDTAINYTDPATAKAIATAVFQQMMGRDPGEGELDAWANALHEAESQAPVTRTTTSEHDPVTGEIIGTSSTSSGGLDAAGRQYIAEERVKDTQEYADVQAATTYANAFEAAVFGSPNLGA